MRAETIPWEGGKKTINQIMRGNDLCFEKSKMVPPSAGFIRLCVTLCNAQMKQTCATADILQLGKNGEVLLSFWLTARASCACFAPRQVSASKTQHETIFFFPFPPHSDFKSDSWKPAWGRLHEPACKPKLRFTLVNKSETSVCPRWTVCSWRRGPRRGEGAGAAAREKERAEQHKVGC